LTSDFGSEIDNVDVRTLEPTGFEELRSVWRERHVIVIRNQMLTVQDQQRFAGRLGRLSSASIDSSGTSMRAAGSIPLVMHIANHEVDGNPGYLPDGELWFHNDQAYMEVPLAAGILYALEVPKIGGATRFSITLLAYRRLSNELKQAIDGRRAENVYDGYATARATKLGEEIASEMHPVVIRHPFRGDPAIFVSRLLTRQIHAVSAAESETMLEAIYRVVEDPIGIYEHHWQVGDLVMWDNLAIQHARTDFDASEPRHLRRLSLVGETRPAAFELDRSPTTL
jgi:taurine dioxygenase